jgi:DNA mismatch repair protein MutS
LQQNELYVTNNVSLGKDDENGILLFGTNAVGKTSLIRALGVAIIIAQSGMFVPSSSFTYKPYTAIYSRILGNDNIFKGLSTFAVEMSELRIILKMSDKNSLILGDELCSGTETESALSIFVAGLMSLDEKKSSFIFATHFHEIVGFRQIESLTGVAMKHMAVKYDRENDCLIYDRKLRDGSGPKSYGLEVCKSLHLEMDFLELAYSIRNEYYPEARGELSHSPSVYNAEKIRGLCEICKEKIGEEVHHLQQQKDANDTGYIGTIHKNHKANLVTVCEECHNKFHVKDNDIVKKSRKKTTNGYKII